MYNTGQRNFVKGAKSKQMTWVIRLLINLVILYVFICIFTYFIQRRLLYYPDAEAPNEAFIKAAGLAFWPSTSDSFRGYISADVDESKSGMVIVFHGNAGSAWNRGYYLRMLKSLGYRVLLAEYPGYGGRSGELCEKDFVQDAKETIRLVYKQYGGPIYLIGSSLGCGVSAGAAADQSIPIDGMVLITPWDTLPKLAQTIYWFLPAQWLTRDKYDNILNLAGFEGRIAVAVAENDEVIPKQHGLNLYESLSNEKKLWTFEGAKHNTWNEQVGVDWWQQVMDFLEKKDEIPKQS